MAQLISIREASTLLGVSTFTLRRLADKGLLKTINIGSRRLISGEEIERLAREGAGRPRRRKIAAATPSGEINTTTRNPMECGNE
jgi:excisionase family DNA binding protein